MASENEPVAAWATDARDKYPENHDSGFAGRLCMADGSLAWAAAVSDGAGGSLEGLKVSALSIQAFVDAVRKSTLADLSDSIARETWLRAWTNALHKDAFARFKGGMATFCGAVLLPPAEEGASWRLFSLNVGDSQIWKLSGDGRCMGIVPDAPPNHANVEGRSPIRVVGVAPKGEHCLVDVEEFALPAAGPCWILAGSDGFFARKKGRDEISIFSPNDMRDVCLEPGVPFQELPVRAIRRSLANAQKLGCAEMMDNATVAMLGFRVPATDLASPASGGFGAAVRVSAPAPAQKPVPAPKPAPAPKAPASPAPSGSKVRSGILAAAVGLLGLATGVAAGRLSSPSPSPAPKAADVPVPEPKSAPVPLPERIKEGRCPFCLELARAHRLAPGRDPYHWAADCDHPDNPRNRDVPVPPEAR